MTYKNKTETFSGPWILVSQHQTLWLGGFFALSEAFAVPIFFTLSGYFTERSLQRSSLLSFWKHRIKRLVIPLLTMLYVVNPLSYFYAYRIHSRAPDVVGLGFAQFYLSHWLGINPAPKFYWKDADLHFPLRSKIHMWFVETLLILTALWTAVRPAILYCEKWFTTFKSRNAGRLEDLVQCQREGKIFSRHSKLQSTETYDLSDSQGTMTRKRSSLRVLNSHNQYLYEHKRGEGWKDSESALNSSSHVENEGQNANNKSDEIEPPLYDSKYVWLIATVGGLSVGGLTWLIRIWFPMDARIDVAFTYIKPARYPQYLFSFGLGVALARYSRTLKSTLQSQRCSLFVMFAWIASFLWWRACIEGNDALIESLKGGPTLASLTVCILEPIVCTHATFGLLSLSLRQLNYENWLTRQLSNATFGVYMFHLPVVMFWQTWLHDWDAHGSIKWLAVTLLAWPSSFCVSLATRHIPLLSTCFGLQK